MYNNNNPENESNLSLGEAGSRAPGAEGPRSLSPSLVPLFSLTEGCQKLQANRNFQIPEVGEQGTLSRSLSDNLLVSYWL